MSQENSQWQVIRPLDAGGMGVVYLCHDPQGQQVVVKLLPRASGQELFQAEIRFLSKLQHPNLVKMLGCAASSAAIFGEERGACFWMEYVAGQDILQAAAQARPDQIAEWFQACVQALSFLHAQDILHGDLSPQNIFIDEHGQPRLLDFGLASTTQQQAPLHAATIPYLAPERFSQINRPASDLFALGTIFYEAFAGKHPRASCQSLGDFMKMPAAPLLAQAPHLQTVHARLTRVIDRLVTIDLAQRFDSADAVLSALGESSGSIVSSQEVYHSAQMYGVAAHVEVARTCLQNLSSRGAALLVHGITGVGKSRFIKELSVECVLNDLQVLDFTAADWEQAFDACERNTTAPVAVVLQGLEQLSDHAWVQLLDRFDSNAGRPQQLLILSWNDDSLSATGQRVIRYLLGQSYCEAIALKNLGRQETEEFLTTALGEELSIEALGLLIERTGGNPLMLVELVNLWHEQSLASDRRVLTEALNALQQVDSLQDVLIWRLKTLSQAERDLLLALAVAQYPVSHDSLFKVLAWDSSYRFERVLQGLQQRDFVQANSAQSCQLAFTFLSGALLQQTDPEIIQQFHQRWLQQLKNFTHPHRQRLHHAMALQHVDEVTQGLRAVVQRLRAQSASQAALDCLESGLVLVTDRDEVSRLLRLQVNLLNELGRFQEAIAVCDQWLELNAADEPAELREVKYWLTTGVNYRNLGDYEASSRCLIECLVRAETVADYRLFAVRAANLLAMNYVDTDELERAQHSFTQALAWAEPHSRQRAEVYRNQAVVLVQQDKYPEAVASLEAAEELYRQSQFPEGEFATLLQRGLLAAAMDEPAVAHQVYARAERYAQSLKNSLFLASVWTNQGILLRKQGQFDQALKVLQRAADRFQILGNPNDLAECLRHLSLAQASVGHFVEAQQTAQALQALSSDYGEAALYVAEVRQIIAEWQSGVLAPLLEAVPADLAQHWNQELCLRCLVRGTQPAVLKQRLENLYEALPPALQVSFVERHDYQSWVLQEHPTPAPGDIMTLDLHKTLVELTKLNQQLLQEDDMQKVLDYLMDAAMTLAGAETGFLMLQAAGPTEGPISGFRMAAFRNIHQQELETDAYAFSVSAVKRALQTGEEVVTDNALQDVRFRDAKSIHLQQLKSILALPIAGDNGVLGIFYLDHRLQPGLFEGHLLQALKAFASTAALTLQKGQMIAALTEKNLSLSEQVADQSTQVEILARELRQSRTQLQNQYREIIGRSPQMISVLSMVDRITDAKVPVWIHGESGTGKEAIARALHYNSPRAKKNFVIENCSALPETLLESELFGHKKGAFTHATQDKKGILHFADEGTIFLDEIADMSLNLQAKLLRFLQEGEIRPLGSTQVVKVDVRVVSASNKDLQQLVAQGEFREDLYYRLNGVTIQLPPLRERMQDLPLLAEHFLKQIALRNESERCTLHPDTLSLFMKYPWPGNIRELQNTLETAVLFAEQNVIAPESLQFKQDLRSSAVLPVSSRSESSAAKAATASADPELIRLLTAIRDNAYHRGNAAQALGISRRHLYTKLEKFGIPRDTAALQQQVAQYLG